MGVALGWIVFTLAGVASAPPADREAAQITYTVRLVDAEGVGWREAVFTHLKPVTRQGAATVWTISDDATNRLLTEVMKSPSARIVQSPKVTSFSGATATIFSRHNQQLVTQVAWHGDDVAPKGARQAVRVGWHTTVVGRKLDQGVLVKLVFEDTEIRAIHQVKLTCDETQACCQAAEGAKDEGVRKAAIEIPEIGSQEVLGEWLIPRGEFLLVSFGAHTIAGKNGMAVVKERLAIIGADEVADASAIHPVAAPASLAPASVHGLPDAPLFLPTPISKIPMPSPAAPSRSIPQGYHRDGTPADMPPLPADEADTDPSSSDSSEPMASPQSKKPQQPKPAADSAANKATFTLPKSPTVFLPSIFLARPSVGFQFLMPFSPLSLKLPFNQRLEIEIYGRMVPDAESR